VKISLQKNSAGIALIIVMIAIAVFSTLAVELWSFMNVETKLAQRADNEQQLLWLGRSGVEYARWILSEEASIAGQPYDALNQIWAGGPGGPAETNSVLAGISLDNYEIRNLKTGELLGTVSLQITDLERKANINTASTAELQQALTLMGVDADDISVVSDSIQDWRSPPAPPRVAGAESDYYQSLTPPYNAKNAPIDDLSELLLIKGVTPEMYYGGSPSNSPAAQHPKLGFGTTPGEAPDYPFGLKDIFTPVSSGKININTADTNVLQMIPGVDLAIANTIIQQRAGPDGVDGTDDDIPIQNPAGALQTAGDNNPQAANYVTMRSSVFAVQVTAKIGDSTRVFHAILYRNTGIDIQVLGFYWE
jgi:general secretion pathway protein K